MKRLVVLVAVALFGRENPFVLPQSGSSSQGENPSFQSSSSSFASKQSEKLLYDFGFVALYEEGKKLSIKTPYKLKRAFSVDNPKKAVFDFAPRSSFASRRVRLQDPSFKSVVVGAHKNYWRVAIEVDRGCDLRIDKEERSLSCR